MSNPGEWSFVAVHDVLADTAPDRDMVVCGTGPAHLRRGGATDQVDRRLPAGAGRRDPRRARRTRALGERAGPGGPRPAQRDGVLRGDVRCVPGPRRPLQRQPALPARGDRGPAGRCRRRGGRLPPSLRPARRDGDRGPTRRPDRRRRRLRAWPRCPAAPNFEEAARTPVTEPLPETSPDDLYLVCTGGTTGRPKAVLWRQADIYVSAMAGVEGATVESIVEAATTGTGSGRPWYPVAPLMHAAAQWTAFSGLNQGATVVVHEDSGPFNARTVLELAEREQVALMSIVGDAYAVPMVDELRRRPYDLSSLFILGTGGAATGEQHTEALLDLLPNVVILDGYGASETGGMAFGARTKGKKSEGFAPSAGRHRDLRGPLPLPGSRRPGGGVDGATRAGAARVPARPGEDRAHLPDHRRGAGRPSRRPGPAFGRWAHPLARAGLTRGQHRRREGLRRGGGGRGAPPSRRGRRARRRPAFRPLRPGGRRGGGAGRRVRRSIRRSIREFVAEEIARFKAPRAVAVVERRRRHANGKPDYGWAKEAALTAADATAGGDGR